MMACRFAARAHRFIDTELSLSNAVALLNTAGVQSRFEANVVKVRASNARRAR
jgi:hypothetical protein